MTTQTEARISELEADRDALWGEIRRVRTALFGAASMLNSAVPGSDRIDDPAGRTVGFEEEASPLGDKPDVGDLIREARNLLPRLEQLGRASYAALDAFDKSALAGASDEDFELAMCMSGHKDLEDAMLDLAREVLAGVDGSAPCLMPAWYYEASGRAVPQL